MVQNPNSAPYSISPAHPTTPQVDRERLQNLIDVVKAIVAVCNQHGATLKVIIEACNLTDDQKVTACRAAGNARAHFVKTSTGMQKGGANLQDVKLMHETVKHSSVLVKAAGGISTVDDALAMKEAGAARFGSSKLLQAIIAEVEGGGVSGNSPGTSLSSY